MLVGSHATLSTLDSITISVDNKHLDEVQSFPYLGLVVDKNRTLRGMATLNICAVKKTIKKPGLLQRF